jgi:hypothetical protein
VQVLAGLPPSRPVIQAASAVSLADIRPSSRRRAPRPAITIFIGPSGVVPQCVQCLCVAFRAGHLVGCGPDDFAEVVGQDVCQPVEDVFTGEAGIAQPLGGRPQLGHSAHLRAGAADLTRCEDGGDCVEVADNLPGVVRVRDSKDLDGAVLIFAPGAWSALVRSVKAGRLPG